MQIRTLLTLASLGLASATPQQRQNPASGGSSSGGDASGSGAVAGQQGGVPTDLAGGFKPDQISLQMSYTGDASQGLKSGAKVSQQDAMKEPQFALGDSSGVNTQVKWVIVIVDTTSKDQRMLHYVKADYMATGQETKIQSKSEPKMAYMGPGMLGEQGQNRQYTALMYTQKGDFPGMGMPEQGKPVVMTDWVKANGLDKAIAGTSFMSDVQSMGNMGGSGGSSSMSGMAAGGNQLDAQSGMMIQTAPMSMGTDMAMPTGGAAGGEAGGAAGAMPTMGAQGGAAGGAGAAGASGAMPSGAMPSGMMNGSMPTGGVQSPTPTAPAASASSKPATGAAAALQRCSAALGLGAVGVFAVALF